MNQDCYEARSLATIYILKILQEHSDESHCLTQQKIIDYLAKDYRLSAERKKIARDIDRLRETGLEINRKKGGYYLERNITDGELSFLIDTVICTKYISKKYSADLIKHLIELGGPSLKNEYASLLGNISENKANNSNIFLYVEDLNKAIIKNRLVSFQYSQYDVDKQLHPGSLVKVSPHSLVVSNGRHGLLAARQRESGEESLSFYYLDRISNLTVLDATARLPKALREKESASVLTEHPFGFGGKTERVTIRILRTLIDDLIEKFGSQFTYVGDPSQVKVTVSLTAGEDDIMFWTLQHAPRAELLEPASLRQKITDKVEKMSKVYKDLGKQAVIANSLGKDGILRLHDIDLREETFFKTFKNVRGAEFSFNEIQDFSFLENYSDLEYLMIEGNPVMDLSVIAKLPRLRKLVLYSLSELESLDFLVLCPNLHTLYLVDSTPENDVIPFYTMPKLRVLNASAIDLRNVDLNKLYKIKPALKVQSESNTMFGKIDTSYLHASEIIDVLEERPYKYYCATLMEWMIGRRVLIGAPKEYFEWLETNLSFRILTDLLIMPLPLNERIIISEKAKGSSTQEIANKTRLSCEAVKCLCAHALSWLHAQDYSENLEKFLPRYSPFVEKYRENLINLLIKQDQKK